VILEGTRIVFKKPLWKRENMQVKQVGFKQIEGIIEKTPQFHEGMYIIRDLSGKDHRIKGFNLDKSVKIIPGGFRQQLLFG